MITEVVRIKIIRSRAAEFEDAFASVAPLIREAQGCHGIALAREIENPEYYVVTVLWETIQAHMNDFRKSSNFEKWRAVVSPFFIEPPVMFHTESVGLRS